MSKIIKSSVIILLAAGTSERFKKESNNIEKQFFTINNKSIFEICLENLINLKLNLKILPVINKKNFKKTEAICNTYKTLPPITGGKTRQKSVYKALQKLKDQHNIKYVLIHDAARPLLSKKVVLNLFNNMNEKVSCVVPYLKVSDAIRKVKTENKLKTLNKNEYILIQTPQLSNFFDLLNSFKDLKDDYDDESSLLFDKGYKIKTILGDRMSSKITYYEDLNYLKLYLKKPMDNYITKVGIGYDVHRLIKSDSNKKSTNLILGGYKIKSNYFLDGHSDADVILHSLTDSIYGAINFLDIGQHFPPSDIKWKNKQSKVFLKHALNELNKKDGKIIHIDMVIITELPKISIYSKKIKSSISNISKISEKKISIKGKSNEGIGFIGRKEGIAVFTNTTIQIKDNES